MTDPFVTWSPLDHLSMIYRLMNLVPVKSGDVEPDYLGEAAADGECSSFVHSAESECCQGIDLRLKVVALLS